MKKTIYLIPGFMCDEKIWIKITPLIYEDFELIYLKIPQKNSLDEIIEEFDNIFKKEEKINILGFSLGGYLAMAYAVRNPLKIDRLMVVSSSIGSLSKEEIIKRKNGLSLIKKYGFKNLSEKAIKVMLEKKDNKELISLIQNMYSNLGEENLFSQMKSTLRRKDLTQELKKSLLKIQFFYSQKDSLIDSSSINDLVQNNRFFKQEVINSSSHMLSLEYPSILVKSIKNWFN